MLKNRRMPPTTRDTVCKRVEIKYAALKKVQKASRKAKLTIEVDPDWVYVKIPGPSSVTMKLDRTQYLLEDYGETDPLSIKIREGVLTAVSTEEMISSSLEGHREDVKAPQCFYKNSESTDPE